MSRRTGTVRHASTRSSFDKLRMYFDKLRMALDARKGRRARKRGWGLGAEGWKDKTPQPDPSERRISGWISARLGPGWIFPATGRGLNREIRGEAGKTRKGDGREACCIFFRYY
ncbi:MAG: hypothetical protein HYX78_15380 [Armatimonadetes bacterium]|nr:hypothetical protein [Armatimonadota bacterium]